jgi:hypothetical protein
MINGLLWLYPGQQLENSLISKLNSSVTKWQKMSERLHVLPAAMRSIILSDLKGAKIPDAMVSKYLTTSRLYGGGGLYKTSGAQYSFEEYSEESHSFRIDGKGYEEFKLRFGTNQSRELEEWFIDTIGADHDKGEVAVKLVEEVSPLPFRFVESMRKPTTTYLEKRLPKNVIFGKSQKLLEECYPFIDSFIEDGHAPKSWVFDYLSGKLKTPTPPVFGCSDEYASLIWSKYEASLINAMYMKRTVPDKWRRLCRYAFENFSQYIHAHTKLPKMY